MCFQLYIYYKYMKKKKNIRISTSINGSNDHNHESLVIWTTVKEVQSESLLLQSVSNLSVWHTTTETLLKKMAMVSMAFSLPTLSYPKYRRVNRLVPSFSVQFARILLRNSIKEIWTGIRVWLMQVWIKKRQLR